MERNSGGLRPSQNHIPKGQVLGFGWYCWPIFTTNGLFSRRTMVKIRCDWTSLERKWQQSVTPRTESVDAFLVMGIDQRESHSVASIQL